MKNNSPSQTVQVQSPLGPIKVQFNEERGIEAIGFGSKNEALQTSTHQWIQNLQQWLNDYFEGSAKKVRIPFAEKGSDFQKKVWKALSHIPYGQTRTYQQIAQSIGHPKSYRAVGNAVGANPWMIYIPCHRVVRASGDLGGYAYGQNIKKELLSIENATYSQC